MFFSSIITSGLILVVTYLIVCLVLGARDMGKIKDLKGFAFGSKGITTAALVSTIYATHLGAGAMFGLIEQINNIGIVCSVAALASAAKWYINNAIFCRNINRFDGCFSASHIMQKLYGVWGLWISNIVNVIMSVGVIAMQVAVIGFIIQYFFKDSAFAISTELAIFIGTGTIVVYSLLGGVAAVILTDILQAILFLIIVTVVFVLSVEKIIINPDFFSSIAESKLWIMPYDWHSGLLLTGIIVYASLSDGHGVPFIQRMLISSKPKQLKKAYAHVAFLDFIVSSMIAIIAVLLLPQTGEGSITKLDIFDVISVSMSPFLIFVTIVGILAITMSTADSWLNAGAVIITHDIIKVFKKDLSENQAVLTARVTTLFMGVAAAWLALFGGSILSLLLLVENFCMPLLSVPFVAGFLGAKCNEKDFIRSVICALAGVALGAYLEGKLEFISLLFGLLGSTIGLFWYKILHFRFPPKGKTKLKLLKQRPINTNFFILVFMGALTYTFVHMYVSRIWMIGDIAVIFSIAASVIGFLYFVDSDKIKKHCAAISVVSLLVSALNLLLRDGGFFSMMYFILLMCFSLLYRQIIPSIIAVIVGFSLSFVPFVIQEMPVISLTAFLTSIMIFAAISLFVCLRGAKERLEEERVLSTTDKLTNLYNRRYMDTHIEGILKDFIDNSKSLSIMAIDVDYFKIINDTYGHQIGDKVLEELGKRIAANFRPETDLCVRTGGEEFVVIMPGVDSKQAQVIAERFRNSIETTPFNIGLSNKPLKLPCTISIGITELQSGDTTESITDRVDQALYHSKKNGRNRVTSSKLKNKPRLASA